MFSLFAVERHRFLKVTQRKVHFSHQPSLVILPINGVSKEVLKKLPCSTQIKFALPY